MIGPTSLGLLLDGAGVSLLSYAFFSTTLKLRRAVEQSIVEAESALLAGSSRRAVRPADWAKLPPPDLEKSLLTMRRDRSHVQWHLWLIISGVVCLICGLNLQLWGSWPN
jgi:hypothetical protein